MGKGEGSDMGIKAETAAVVQVHVSRLRDAEQLGRLVETADIVQLVHLAGHASTSRKQLADYVAYCLREGPHVCRYATGYGRAQRFLHLAAECTPACKAIDVHGQKPGNARAAKVTAPGIPTRLCDNCYITVPNGAECGFCE